VSHRLHPLLAQTFAALDAADVRWCLERIPSHPTAPQGDVDLLVAPPHLDRLPGLLRPLGFAALPGWSDGPDRLFLTYHHETDQWIWLDVASQVNFGRDHDLRTVLADGCLERRRQAGEMWLPSDDDAFWLLLLHCLLDKQAVPSHYRARLRDLAAHASTDGDFGHLADRICPGEWSAFRLVEASRSENWAALESLAPHLATRWRRQLSRGERTRSTLRRVGRWLRKPLLLRRRRGVSVALLGANGAGKSTLAQGLKDSFCMPVASVYMGLWASGDAPARPTIPGLDIAVRPFKVWARYLLALSHQARGHLVVFDRYTYDALQDPQPPLAQLKRPYFWLLAHTCPPPDLVLVLDVPGTVSFARKGEYPAEELEGERRSYLRLRTRLPQLQVLDATQPRDRVRADAMERIWQQYRARWRQT
jgi:thymidylate kinase